MSNIRFHTTLHTITPEEQKAVEKLRKKGNFVHVVGPGTAYLKTEFKGWISTDLAKETPKPKPTPKVEDEGQTEAPKRRFVRKTTEPDKLLEA